MVRARLAARIVAHLVHIMFKEPRKTECGATCSLFVCLVRAASFALWSDIHIRFLSWHSADTFPPLNLNA